MKIKITKEDRLFSECVRRRAMCDMGGCEYCGKPKYDKTREDGSLFPAWMTLECSHYVGRGTKATRYDLENAIGACFSCHQWLGAHPYQHTEFFKKRLGSDRFEKLNIRAETTHPKPDLEKITLELKEKIRVLESE